MPLSYYLWFARGPVGTTIWWAQSSRAHQAVQAAINAGLAFDLSVITGKLDYLEPRTKWQRDCAWQSLQPVDCGLHCNDITIGAHATNYRRCCRGQN